MTCTPATRMTVTDTIGDGGTITWDRDSQDLRDAIGGWYDLSVPAGEDPDGDTIGDVLDTIDGMIARGDCEGDLTELLGITIAPADDGEDAE